MDQQVFYEVVVPLLGMRDAALLAISTILDPSNFYTKLVEMVDGAGEPLFEIQKFEMVCAACKKTDEPWKCTHMGDTMPPWMSGEKHEKIRHFMPEELMGRETMGISMTDARKAFNGKIVREFEKKPARPLPTNTGFIFTAVDPNAGGLSEYAVVSIVVFEGSTTVSAHPTDVFHRRPNTSVWLQTAAVCHGARSTASIKFHDTASADSYARRWGTQTLGSHHPAQHRSSPAGL